MRFCVKKKFSVEKKKISALLLGHIRGLLASHGMWPGQRVAGAASLVMATWAEREALANQAEGKSVLNPTSGALRKRGRAGCAPE